MHGTKRTKESIRVLHVDDDSTFLKVAKECLEMQGPFKVDAASSVDEALKKMKEEEYDTVVFDYQMTEREGLEFLKRLGREGNGIPFMILTGKGREEVAIEALNLGADRYFNKTGDQEILYCELAHAIRLAVDRRSAQIELLEREAKLTAILESSLEAIIISDLDGNIVECNQATGDLYGGQLKEDLVGKNAFELIGKKGHVKAIQNLKKTIEQGSVKTVEYALLTEDGHELPKELSASVVRNASGKPEYLVAITRDSTERKKTESEIESLARFPPENPNPVLRISKDGIILYANPAAKFQLNELKPEIGELAPQRWRRLVASILNSGEKEEIEVEHGNRIFLFTLAPANGTSYVNIYGVDITERKKAEEALKESEGKLRDLVKSAGDWIWQVDKNGVYSYTSPQIKDILGYEPEEVVGKTPFEFMPEDEAKKMAKSLRDVLEKKEPFRRIENWHVHKNGTAVLLETSGVPLFNQPNDLVGCRGISRDVTQRKETEEKLRRLATIVTDSNDAIAVVDLDGRITTWNKGAEYTYGYREDEALGMSYLQIVPEDKKQETLDFIGKIKMNETVGSFETKRLAKDGRVMDTWIGVTALVGDDGNAIAFAITEHDITEKKRLEERLRVSEKFTYLGQLASSIAHEIRNPLGVIKNSVYFLNLRLQKHPDEKVARHLKIMEENINSADHIIGDLLGLAKNKVGVLESVDLNIILERAFASLSVPENIKVITKLEKTPEMLLDRERIQRVFVNLIENAVAAMPEGGKLIVGISSLVDSVAISFKDTGVGIPEKDQKKLFTPLFTTKAKGLGLGLAICKQIVEGHRGNIEVKSKVREGALFTVRLPILSRAELVKIGVVNGDLLTGGMAE